MPRKKNARRERVTFALRMDALSHTQIALLSDIEDRSMNYLINKAIEEYLDKPDDDSTE